MKTTASIKPALMFVFFMGLLTLASSCGSSGGGGSSAPAPAPAQPTQPGVSTDQFASTPQPCNYQNSQLGIPVPQNCSIYSQYYTQWPTTQTSWSYGAWYWPQQYQPSTTNCGCPSGYLPVYGLTYGIACAPTQYFGNQVVYYNVGYTGGQYWNQYQNTGWVNIPQNTYNPYQTSYNGCLATTAQGCDVRLNNCPTGSVCQPAGGGSTIGLCARY